MSAKKAKQNLKKRTRQEQDPAKKARLEQRQGIVSPEQLDRWADHGEFPWEAK
jgi:hypothetical protein